jgi:hypothetical protein
MSPEPWSWQLRGSLLDHLWSQWSALGASGYGEADLRIIDPEALLLCSLEQARFDARLFDVILDWCEVNGSFLSIPRLKALSGPLHRSRPVVRQLAALAELSQAASRGAWRKLLEPGLDPRPPEPLFLTQEGLTLPLVGAPDPVFLRHGLLREVYALRRQASPFPPGEPAAMILSLRALLGSSARCEILAQLCGGREQTPSQLARQTGYSQKNVQDAMVDMARSGHVKVRSAGREKRYRLDEPFRRFLCAGNALTPYPWLNLYPLAAEALDLLVKAEGLGLAEASVHPRLRQALEARLPSLLEGGLRPELFEWESTGAFVALLVSLLVGGGRSRNGNQPRENGVAGGKWYRNAIPLSGAPMRALPFFATCLAAGLTLGAAAPKDATFTSLARIIVEDTLRTSPEFATQQGDHRWDNRLSDYSAEAVKKQEA